MGTFQGKGHVAKEGEQRTLKAGGILCCPSTPTDSEPECPPTGLADSPFPPQGAPRPCWTSQAWIFLLRAPPTWPCPPTLVIRPALSSPAPLYPCLMMSSCLWVRKKLDPGRGEAQL